MVNSALALQIRPPQFDLPGALAAASRIKGLNTQNQLAQFRLGEAQGSKNALAAYNEARESGDPKALDTLSAYPDLHAKALGIKQTEGNIRAGEQNRQLLEAARSADHILSLPGPMQEAEWKQDLDGDLARGEITQEQYSQYMAFTPEQRRQALNQIRMQALSMKEKIALEKGAEPTAAMREAEYFAKQPEGSPQRAYMLKLPKFQKTEDGRILRLNEAGEAEDVTPKALIKERGEAGIFKTPQDRVKHEQAIRKEYTGVVKDFRTVRDAAARVEASAKNPSAAGDLAMIFNYMKVLDPGSVVRESEFATAAASGSYGERLKAAGERILSGQRLSDEMRADFLSRTKDLYRAQEGQFNKTTEQYQAMVNRLGLRGEDTILDYTPPSAYGGIIPEGSKALLREQRSDPEAIREFDARYGEGAAARILSE